jgi:ABC-2 type transport system ATP-binding protein
MILQIDDLSYTYPASLTGKRSQGLRNVTLSIEKGECFAFLGHNGAGKTTTIKCILNLIHPTSGSVRINGIDSRSPESRRIIGYVPEQPYFYDNLSVEESVTMYGRLAGLTKTGITTAVDAALLKVRLADRRHQRLRTLSKGLTQRVALAQAIVASPELLILDEPFSGLDPIGRKEFREIFFDLNRSGVTLFMSSHVLSDVEQLCSRASILAHGELKGVFDLSTLPSLSSKSFELVVSAPREGIGSLSSLAIATREERSAYRLSFTEQHNAEQALRVALNSGYEVLSYQCSRGTLEDLFTSVVKAHEVNE